jgi:hypothetical protein
MSDHKSFVARLGQIGQKYTDPLAWAFGRKYTDKLVDIADFSNKAGSTLGRPLVKADKTLNPLRRIGAYNKVASWTEAKPADSGAIAAGAYFGAGALGGAGGAGGGSTGGSLGGGTAGGGGSLGGGSLGGGGAAAGATGAGEVIPEVVITGSTGSGLGTAAGVGAGAGAGATAANGNSSNSWRDQMQMPGQQDQGEDPAVEAQRRQMEAMIEQERLRREQFRRNQIAKAMLS